MLRDEIGLFDVKELQQDEESMFQRLTARSVEFSNKNSRILFGHVLSCCSSLGLIRRRVLILRTI